MLSLPQPLPLPSDSVPSFLCDLSRRRDNVHDFVFLNEIESKLVDTREFQRLRNIKQLGFANLVYESAEHSRFVHSLGVCHTAKALVDYVNRNRTAILLRQKKTDGRELPATLFAMPESENTPELPPINWAHRVVIGIAALLHDLPHPPMSHALEHESSVLVKHDKVNQNPQLYIYLFGADSSLANVLRKFSERFRRFLIDSEAFAAGDIDGYLASNNLSRQDLLAALVFEILAFSTPEQHPHRTFEYVRDWSGAKETFSISTFFAPYSAELISNTICADLIDYLLRDADNTGIQRATDLKFLDRITVKTERRISQGQPRVVFDLVDHRRGELRKDTLSDLLALLESRYSLMERVYMHRTKLAASAMLGRAYALAKEAGIGGIDLPDLYSVDGPCSDDALLRRLLKSGVQPVEKLTAQLLSRNLYKPLFVIDEEVCKSRAVTLDRETLVRQFRPTPALNSITPDWRVLLERERSIAEILLGTSTATAGSHPIILFCMGETVAYKDPKVLVEVPERGMLAGNREVATELRSIPSASGLLSFLKDVASDHGVRDQISAMLSNFKSLWKLYVFADPEVVEDNIKNVPAAYAKLVEIMGRSYPVSGYWTGMLGDGITEDSLNRAVAELEGSKRHSPKAPDSVESFLLDQRFFGLSNRTARSRMSSAGIGPGNRERVWNIFWPEFRTKYPNWSAISQNDVETLRPWALKRLAEIASEISE